MKNNIAIKRIAAYLIDYLVITFISSSLVYLTFINPRYDEYLVASTKYNEIVTEFYNKEIDNQELLEQTSDLSYDLNNNGYVYTIGGIVIAFLYYGVFAYYTNGQTLGKKILGIRIANNKGGKVKLYQYFIRAFILNGIISSIITLIAVCFKEEIFFKIYSVANNFNMILLIVLFLMVLFYKDGRGLHDILAGTKVVDVRNENNLKVNDEEVKITKPNKNKQIKK